MKVVAITNIEKRLARGQGTHYLDPKTNLKQWAKRNGYEIVSVENCPYENDPAEVVARDAHLVLGPSEKLAVCWQRYLERSKK